MAKKAKPGRSERKKARRKMYKGLAKDARSGYRRASK